MVYAQPVGDIENARAAPPPPQFNLVGPNQSALIFISDQPMHQSMREMLAARPAPTAPTARPAPTARRVASPQQDHVSAGGLSALQVKLITGILGAGAALGAGAVAYKKLTS